jgi:hypothetical protein
MPYLAFNLNNGNEFVFDLVEERHSLGRNPRNEIVIDNICISNFHAEFRRQADGNYEVIDLKSSGGTFVNEMRIDRVVLRSGDRVHFGPLQARYALGELAAVGRLEEGPTLPAADKMPQGREPGDRNDETDIAHVRETPEDTTPPPTSVEVPSPTPVVQPDPAPFASVASQETGALVTRLRLKRPAPAELHANPPAPLQATLVPPAEALVPGLVLQSLIDKAPELAAAMDAGLYEQRARMETEREVVQNESAGTESFPTGPAAVEEKNVGAISTIAVASVDHEATTGEACIKVLHAEMVQLERARAEVAAVKLEVEKSKRDLEAVQQRLAEHKSTEQNTRERLAKQSRDTEENLARLGEDLKQVENRLAGAHNDNMRLTAHMGRFMTVLILAILLALASAVFWIDQILPTEIQTRLAADKANRLAESGNGGPSRTADPMASGSVNGAHAGMSLAQNPIATPAPVASSLLGEDLTPSQRELVLLKERNRLTAYADEAIATGGRTPYERLWETFDDPQLANLVHAARAEILRVQSAYLSGSRIDRFDIPVADYFPEDSGLTEDQLKDGQLIKLLGDAANPWEVRMKAANLLGTRRSMEAGDALVQAVKSDANLDVVKEATFSFDQMTGYHSKIFDAASLEKWWKEYKANPQPPGPNIASPAVKAPKPDATKALTTH